ncbi:MAG: hypothetical protein KDA38_03975, partial [Planctomycetales bacterium]|nr:hypothetical protein [Planctomycetales bacterium]
PQAFELYNIAKDPSEQHNRADEHPEIVEELRARANALAATMAKPLLLETEFQAVLERLAAPPALPKD